MGTSCGLTAAELATAYRRREVSPVEVVRDHLERIERLGDLGAYITVDVTGAAAAAERSQRRFARSEPLSDLDGIPVSIKDNIDVAGVPTTAGSLSQPRSPASRDASAVARLRSGGAIVLGKNSLFELAAGGGPRHEGGFPVARNPWNVAYATGGSSSGSAAAVAAGLATAALGTDSGGSVRYPAALCGVVGLKPSSAALPVDGIRVLSHTLDQIGIFARSARDVMAMFDRVSGRSVGDGGGRPDPLRGLRVGVPERLLAHVAEMDAVVLAALRHALGALEDRGASVVPIDTEHITEAGVVGSLILRAEAIDEWGELARRDPASFGRRFFFLLLQGSLISRADRARAQRARARLTAEMDRALAGVDVVAMPTAPTPAWPVAIDEASVHVPSTPDRHLLVYVFNVTGKPAVSVPWERSTEGLPIGVQLAGHFGRDRALLRIAAALEELRPWPRLATGVPPS